MRRDKSCFTSLAGTDSASILDRRDGVVGDKLLEISPGQPARGRELSPSVHPTGMAQALEPQRCPPSPRDGISATRAHRSPGTWTAMSVFASRAQLHAARRKIQ